MPTAPTEIDNGGKYGGTRGVITMARSFGFETSIKPIIMSS
jgi:hypothetical protein